VVASHVNPILHHLNYFLFLLSWISIKATTKQTDKAERELQTELIAKGVIRLPEVEGYPQGPERPGVINYALENDNAALLITCYGREGGPVAAKRYVGWDAFLGTTNTTTLLHSHIYNTHHRRRHDTASRCGA